MSVLFAENNVKKRYIGEYLWARFVFEKS